MQKIIIAFLVMLITTVTGKMYAHEGHHHKNEKKDSAAKTVAAAPSDSLMQQAMEEHEERQAVNAFPNYHPLIVHFPIVLLLLAAIFQLFSFFIYKKELSWLTLLLLGVIATWLASNTFHTHPEELTGRSKETFEIHEQMASFTWWFSIAALAIKIISHFFLKRKWWMESIVALLLVGSAITVSIAGHHGAMLVHIEGIGPQGKYLESNHHKK